MQFSNSALKKLIIPLVIEQFLAVMVGMADIAMVSSAGETAVSSVALVDLINVLILTVFSSLATVTPQSLLASLFPVALVLILGAIGTILTAFVTARIFKKSVYLNIALAITCTFGFPTTALISEEIATSVGQTDLEKQGLRNYLLPQMTVAGFVTVTIGSVILAGAVVPFLGA